MSSNNEAEETKKVVTQLRADSERILKTWEERARKEIHGADDQTHESFRDSIPKFLNELATAIEKDAPLESVGQAVNVFEQHAKDRAGNPSYDVKATLMEYFILRDVLLSVLEEEKLLDRKTRSAILSALDNGVQAVVSESNKIIDAHREKVMAALVHDIRNPLSAHQLALSLLKKNYPELISLNAGLFQRMDEGLDRMEKMIGTILDVALVRSGQGLQLDLVESDLRELVGQVVSEFQKTYGMERIRLEADKEIRGNWSIDYIHRAMENLISNAIKYGERNQLVTIHLKARPAIASVSVHNWGKPISVKDSEHIFHPFQRGPTGKETGEKGWGIGLTLVRGVAEAHGGKVKFESSETKGTTFRMILNRCTQAKTQKAA